MFVLLDATLEEAALVPSTRQGLFGVQTHPPPGKTGIAETLWAETKIWISLKWWVREDTVIGGVWVGSACHLHVGLRPPQDRSSLLQLTPMPQCNRCWGTVTVAA